MNLYLADHRFEEVHKKPELFIGSIEVEAILRSLPEETKIVNPYDANYAITHYTSSALDQLDESTNLEDYPNLQIVFCVTTDKKNGSIGYSENERKHQKKQSKNKVRYVLYGRKLDELDKPEVLAKVLKAFCSLTMEQADAIVEKDFDKMPKDLINIFHLIRVDNLTALSILCQGYLAVHSESSYYRNLEKSVKDLLGDVSKKTKDTEKSKWWKYPFNSKTQASLTQKLEEEWQPEKLSSEISDLIDTIYQDERITEDKVQKAYHLIVNRLV